MRDVGELAGPKVYAERGASADAGGGVLMVSAGRIEVRGRMRSRQLGFVSELSSLSLEDAKGHGANLAFADGSTWHLSAESGGLDGFARELEARLGIPGLVRDAPPIREQLRETITSEGRRGIIAIAIAFALILPVRWLCVMVPPLGWVVLVLAAIALIATGLAQAVPDPAPGGPLERIKAEHWGYTVVLPLSLAAAAGMAIAAARGEAVTRELATQADQQLEGRREAERLAEEAAREAEAARVEKLAAELKAALAEQDWRKAQQRRDALRELDPKHPSLAAVAAKLDPELARIDELDRLKAVQRGLSAARRMSRDRVRCERANDVASAWRDLRRVRPDDPEWEDALKLVTPIERCRKRVERLLVRSAGNARRQQLELEARALEDRLRNQGQDARAACSGATCGELVVTIAGLTAKLAAELTEDGSRSDGAMLARLERAGAQRVIFTGIERVTYKLQPTDLRQVGKEVLAKAELDKPLSLEGGAAAETGAGDGEAEPADVKPE